MLHDCSISRISSLIFSLTCLSYHLLMFSICSGTVAILSVSGIVIFYGELRVGKRFKGGQKKTLHGYPKSLQHRL